MKIFSHGGLKIIFLVSCDMDTKTKTEIDQLKSIINHLQLQVSRLERQIKRNEDEIRNVDRSLYSRITRIENRIER